MLIYVDRAAGAVSKLLFARQWGGIEVPASSPVTTTDTVQHGLRLSLGIGTTRGSPYIPRDLFNEIL